ncbi:MAG: ZPR1 zinc finger domain-containing protein, partial [Candidatus Woesearchaeota archaeon]|nr:ZPR1 zinc finger domain-containing protein [Candidatus Woesearchaeota archaeon]
IEVESEDDLKVRVVKSSEGKVKIPHVMTIEPGPSSNGYITNVEGVLNRVKAAIEIAKEAEDDPAAKKKAKKLLKKVNKVLWGQEKIKIIIEDKSGNSAIISDKAVKKEL